MDYHLLFIVFLLLFFDKTRNLTSRQILKIVTLFSPPLFMYLIYKTFVYPVTIKSIGKILFLIYFFIIWKPKYIRELEGLCFKFIQPKNNGYGSFKIYGKFNKLNKCVYGIFPHGAQLHSVMFLSKKMYDESVNKKIVCAPNLLKLPFLRIFLNSCFDCITADKKDMMNHLQGNNLLMYPGGIKDMFDILDYPNKTIVNISKITTLIKMMKDSNANMVPIIIFNEYDHICNPTIVTRFFKYINYNIFRCGILTPPLTKTKIFNHTIYFPLLCNFEPIHIAIGDTVEMCKNDSDYESKQKIKNEVIRVWKKYMDRAGKTMDDLVIV